MRRLTNQHFARRSQNTKLFRSNMFFSSQTTQNSLKEKLPTQIVENIPDLREFLIDNYSRMHNYLRISLSERCNLRCQVNMRIYELSSIACQRKVSS